MADVSVIILTLDEDHHIGRAIRSVSGFAKEVLIVDSYSTDETQSVAEKHGARFVQHPFENHAAQLNWALTELDFDTEWVMRIDADEYVLPELASEIEARLPALPSTTAAIRIGRRVVFMGRWIRHGGIYPTARVRIWRRGRGRAESRSMDEHMEVDGEIETFENDLVDESLNSLKWWTAKHNAYSSKEADQLAAYVETRNASIGGGSEARTRWAKERLYLRLAPVWRAWGYFLYRYLLRGGFLDGREGLLFHTMQGLWYRLLADAKLIEGERANAGAESPGGTTSQGEHQ